MCNLLHVLFPKWIKIVADLIYDQVSSILLTVWWINNQGQLLSTLHGFLQFVWMIKDFQK